MKLAYIPLFLSIGLGSLQAAELNNGDKSCLVTCATGAAGIHLVNTLVKNARIQEQTKERNATLDNAWQQQSSLHRWWEPARKVLGYTLPILLGRTVVRTIEHAPANPVADAAAVVLGYAMAKGTDTAATWLQNKYNDAAKKYSVLPKSSLISPVCKIFGYATAIWFASVLLI